MTDVDLNVKSKRPSGKTRKIGFDKIMTNTLGCPSTFPTVRN